MFSEGSLQSFIPERVTINIRGGGGGRGGIVINGLGCSTKSQKLSGSVEHLFRNVRTQNHNRNCDIYQLESRLRFLSNIRTGSRNLCDLLVTLIIQTRPIGKATTPVRTYPSLMPGNDGVRPM